MRQIFVSILAAGLLAGCSHTTENTTTKVALNESATYQQGWLTARDQRVDYDLAGVFVGGAVSILTGSPWPAVAGVGSKGLTALGQGLGRTAAMPAAVLENMTTSTEVRR